MRLIKEDDISKLRKGNEVTAKDGSMLKAVIPIASKKPSAPKLTELELQTKAIKTLAAMLATMMHDHNRNSTKLMEAVVQVKPIGNIPAFPAFPEFPGPVLRWDFHVERDDQGFIKTIKAEAL